jgi:parallel beta-helix repeat protein
MTYGSNAGGVYNLEGITLVGDNNQIDNNNISRIGYNGIKIYYGGSCRIENNIIDSCGLRLSDAGGIYSWHSFEGNKLIKNNKISNVTGDKSGTTDPAKHHGRGIYLDELSLHFKVENNEIHGCGEGIYVQNSRNDTIIGNTLYNNYMSELHINSGGSILNGGNLNPFNDIYFNPDTLSKHSLGKYIWDRKEGLIYNKNKDHTVFVEPVKNLIVNNSIMPSDTTFTFIFRTWREVNDKTLEKLTSNSDFINNNLPEGVSSEKASLLMSSSNVWVPAEGKKVYMVGKADIDRSKFPKLRELKTEVIMGTKY